jgi:hypothetical protein
MRTEKATDADAKRKALEAPSECWVDPNGGGPKARGLSWQKWIREGGPDKAKNGVAERKPKVEKLRLLLLEAQARGQDFVAVDYRRTLEILEPQLEYWSALLKASAPWIGCAGKSLDLKVQAAEAREAEAEAPTQELEAAYRTLAGLAAANSVGMKELDAAIGPLQKALAANLAIAKDAAAAARSERDANSAEIARLEKELATLSRRAA